MISISLNIEINERKYFISSVILQKIYFQSWKIQIIFEVFLSAILILLK